MLVFDGLYNHQIIYIIYWVLILEAICIEVKTPQPEIMVVQGMNTILIQCHSYQNQTFDFLSTALIVRKYLIMP